MKKNVWPGFVVLLAVCTFGVFANAQPREETLRKQLNEGAAFLKAGQPAQAVREFEKVIESFERVYKDQNVNIYAVRSNAEKLEYLSVAEKPEDGVKKKAVFAPLIWSDALSLKASALLQLVQRPEAKTALESAIRMAPSNARYLSEMGEIYLKERSWANAYVYFERAEVAAPAFSPPSLKSSELLRALRGSGDVFFGMRSWDEAERKYQQCLEIDKRDTAALGMLASIKAQRNPENALAATANLGSREIYIAAPSSAPMQIGELLETLYAQILSAESSVFPGSGGLLSVQGSLRQLGAQAWPLAPRIAEVLAQTEKNSYSLAWILVEMVPPQAADERSATTALARFATAKGNARLVELARLGKTQSALVVPTIQSAAQDESANVRLLAGIGLAYAGSSEPSAAATSLSRQLTDKDRTVRFSAANSLSLLGPRAEVAAPALVAYLRTGESPTMATRALKEMPISYLRDVKFYFESIVTDSRLSNFQKVDAAAILARLKADK